MLTCLFGSPDNLQWKRFCELRYGGNDPVIEQFFPPKVTLKGKIRAFFLRPYFKIKRKLKRLHLFSHCIFS